MTGRDGRGSYIEIIAVLAAADAERAADVLGVVTGSSGAWTDLPFTQHDLESDAIVGAAHRASVHAYIPNSDDGARVVARAHEALTAAGIAAEMSTRVTDEEDWAEAWKAHFKVERYGARLVVVPSWLTYAAREGDVVIDLDPGMAFGTGQHETTRMCLEAIEYRVASGDAVLDVGCGSGILSLAAAKLDAREVLAVDIDPNCVRITSENAERNGVAAIVRAETGKLGDPWPFDVAAIGRFDVIVANILARPIIESAADLRAALRPGGRVIASGIIGEREGEVVAALRAAGLRIDDVRAMADWRCVEAVAE